LTPVQSGKFGEIIFGVVGSSLLTDVFYSAFAGYARGIQGFLLLGGLCLRGKFCFVDQF
jgi:uncharacterized membrane protein YeaQ/YmgE (transglycosylase-associated protein family)